MTETNPAPSFLLPSCCCSVGLLFHSLAALRRTVSHRCVIKRSTYCPVSSVSRRGVGPWLSGGLRLFCSGVRAGRVGATQILQIFRVFAFRSLTTLSSDACSLSKDFQDHLWNFVSRATATPPCTPPLFHDTPALSCVGGGGNSDGGLCADRSFFSPSRSRGTAGSRNQLRKRKNRSEGKRTRVPLL